MRGSQFLLAGWMFALPLLARGLGDTSDENSLGDPQDQDRKGITPATSATPTATSTTSTSNPYSFSSTTSATSSTTTRTFDVSSLISSLSSDITTASTSVDVYSLLSSLSQHIPSSIITSEATASATGASSSSSDSGLLSTSNFASSGSPASTAPPSTSAVTSSSMSHQDLSIVLAVVLSLLGLILIAAALFLLYRYRSSPIGDDEIATWRGAMIDPEGPPIAMNQTDNPKSPNRTVRTVRQASTITFTHSPGWTWTANSSPASTRSGFVSGEAVPNTPSFLVRAPNARTGLTDEAIPGADPFITPVKRQSSRLSKMPRGHGRSKSRRSSISAKSIMSYHGGRESSGKERIGMWYDPDEEGVQKDGRKSRRTNSSPNTSVFDEGHASESGGLSPRPKSHSKPETRDRDIGRAMQ